MSSAERDERLLRYAQALASGLARRHPDLVHHIGHILKRLQPARPGVDFASLVWYGTRYHFTPAQAAVVKLLWQAWEDGTLDVRQETLLMESGSTGKRLRDIFKENKAFGTIIVSKVQGCYRLVRPTTPGGMDPEPVEPEPSPHF